MQFLMSHEDFERSLKKYLSPTLYRNVQDKLDNIRKKVRVDPCLSVRETCACAEYALHKSKTYTCSR